MNRVSYLSPVRISLPAPCLLGHLVSLGSLRCLRRVLVKSVDGDDRSRVFPGRLPTTSAGFLVLLSVPVPVRHSPSLTPRPPCVCPPVPKVVLSPVSLRPVVVPPVGLVPPVKSSLSLLPKFSRRVCPRSLLSPYAPAARPRGARRPRQATNGRPKACGREKRRLNDMRNRDEDRPHPSHVRPSLVTRPTLRARYAVIEVR